jgi:glycosyltransferase involved in cell wall biosynthesis
VTPDATEPGILIVTDAYPPDCGGSGWSTHALVTQLREAGSSVDIMVVDPYGTAPPAEREFEGTRLRTVSLGSFRTPARHFSAEDYSCGPVREHVAEYLAQRPDIRIVHGQHLHSGQGAAIAARAAGCAALVTLRDCWPTRLDGVAFPSDDEATGSPRDWARRALVDSFGMSAPVAALASSRALLRLASRQRGLAACHRVLCVSRAIEYRVGQHLSAPIDIVPNMIDPIHSARAAERGTPSAIGSAPYLLMVGKLNAIKGFDRVVDELVAAECSWPLVVAGAGPAAEAMRASAAAAGLELVHLGWTEGDTVMRLARDARAVIVPSVWVDALPRVILEAMSLGTPPIARATGGSPEAISNGHDGFLYSSVDQLAIALRHLEDDLAAERIGHAALESCKAKYAPDVVLGQVRQSYERALAEVDNG